MDDHNRTEILVIDDEAYIRDSVKAFLEDYGYHVNEAKNGRDALLFFEKKSRM
ncbi:hypothetical protein [Desulfamplus magnetovallimortis]|nr:hypothetical protein [Desulfamplus magnetovallimortis]